MDFRDWLIIVGIVIILGILADGYRRMRLARMDSLKMSRNMGAGIENTPLDDDYNPELPGGGARVVAPGVEQNDKAVDGLSAGLEDGEDAESGDMGEEVPLAADRSDRIDYQELVAREPAKSATAAAATDSADDEASDSIVAEAENKAEKTEYHEGAADIDQEVIVINVDAKADQIFLGSDIKKLLEACGMEHGDMSIFHRHEEDDLLSPIQFSVANAVEPGYFDPENMEKLVTPGVSFFMSLPGPKDYMKAFDYMLETAQCFASNLGGDLSDERRSVLTKQTIEHFRHRVREFERKQLSKSKA